MISDITCLWEDIIFDPHDHDIEGLQSAVYQKLYNYIGENFFFKLSN